MKREFLLIALMLVVGCAPGQKKTNPIKDNTQPTKPSTGEVSVSGGDGSSIENAVIIKAPNNFAGVDAEYKWIKKNHPGWKLVTQSVVNKKGKLYDKMDFQTPEGQAVTLYFDITDFFGKM
jgi:hypothetical protein